jgi:hypothetical protein
LAVLGTPDGSVGVIGGTDIPSHPLIQETRNCTFGLSSRPGPAKAGSGPKDAVCGSGDLSNFPLISAARRSNACTLGMLLWMLPARSGWTDPLDAGRDLSEQLQPLAPQRGFHIDDAEAAQ